MEDQCLEGHNLHHNPVVSEEGMSHSDCSGPHSLGTMPQVGWDARQTGGGWGQSAQAVGPESAPGDQGAWRPFCLACIYSLL